MFLFTHESSLCFFFFPALVNMVYALLIYDYTKSPTKAYLNVDAGKGTVLLRYKSRETELCDRAVQEHNKDVNLLRVNGGWYLEGK